MQKLLKCNFGKTARRAFFIFLFPSFLLYSKEDPAYVIEIDRYFSPVSFAKNFVSLSKITEDVDDLLFGEHRSINDFAHKISRLSNIVVFWLPFGDLIATTQHEVFGHGYRIRTYEKYKAIVKGYSIGVPPPYGRGGGSTSFRFSDWLSITELTAIDIAGMEANFVLANTMKDLFFIERSIDGRMAPLYISSLLDFTTYAFHTWLIGNSVSAGNDIDSYVNLMNYSFGKNELSVKSLMLSSLVNFIDPYFFSSLAAAGMYVGRNETFEPFYIQCGNYQITPALSAIPTPFGMEYWARIDMRHKKFPFLFYVRGGAQNDKGYGGIGMRFPNIRKWRSFHLGGRLDFWIQPGYFNGSYIDTINDLAPYPPQMAPYRFGALAEVFINIPLDVKKENFFHLEVGYKSPGYIPGEFLYHSPICRAGFSKNF